MITDPNFDSSQRLAELTRLQILDSAESGEFNDIVDLAASVCDSPIAMFTLIDDHRQWFKAKRGISISETPIESSICAFAIAQNDLLVVSDLRKDPRFRQMPYVMEEPFLQFYAGAAVRTKHGVPIGTLCVCDTEPRDLTEKQAESLRVLSRMVGRLVENRYRKIELSQARNAIEMAKTPPSESLRIHDFNAEGLQFRVAYIDPEYRYRYANEAYRDQLGISPEQLIGKTVTEVFGSEVAARSLPFLNRALSGEMATTEQVVPYPQRTQHLRATFIPDIAPNGEVRGVVIHMLEVTQLREIEKILMEERAVRDWTLEMANIATFVWDIQKNEIVGNPLLNRFFGLPDEAQHLPRERYFAAIHPDDHAEVVDRSGASTEGRQSYEARYRLTGFDGKIRWVLSRGEPTYDSEGRPHKLAGVVVDITEQVEAEQALVASQGLLASMFDMAQIGIWSFDMASRTVSYDAVSAALHGLEPVAVKNGSTRTLHRFADHDDLERGFSVFDKAEATGEPYEFQFRVHLPTGTRWILERGTAVKDESGLMVELRGIFLDVTEQKNVQEKERLRLAELLELSPAYMAVKEGPELRFAYFNSAFQRQVGQRELLGLSLREAMPEMALDGHLEIQEEVFRTGIPYTASELSVKVQRDPEGPLTQTFVTVAHQAMRDENGVITGIFTHGYDVTDVVRSRQDLVESEEKFRTVFESAEDDAIILADESGKISAWNPAAEKLTGWPAHEVLGRSLGLLLPEEDYDRQVQEEIVPESIANSTARIDCWHVRKDGTRFWCNGTVSFLFNTDGSVRGFLKVFRDVTKRYEEEQRIRTYNEELESKVAERTERLAQAVKEAEAFNYALSHDLRSPVRAIAGTASILIEEASANLSEEHIDLLRRQERNARRLGELTDELLRLSRLSRAKIVTTELDLSELTRSVVLELCPEQKVIVQPGLRGVGDAHLVRTVLDNLLSNAMKFSTDDSSIEVGQTGESFWVRDHGIGFDTQFIDRIFLPFERLVTQSEFPGTGIGLANVERIVRRHGGRVWAESEPGKGSTFFFTLG